MENIFADTPKTYPSLLNSIAGLTTALEKPVIGTKAPALPHWASLSYTFSPVSSAPKKISVIEAVVWASFTSIPKCA